VPESLLLRYSTDILGVLGGKLLANWWYTYPSEKYESDWIYWIIIPNLVGQNKIQVPNHQPVGE
jgi:hypothetical protein